jgi:hypothetical protein
MEDWKERTLSVTVVLLFASAVLMLPALAGVGASLPYLGALVVLAGALAAGRSVLAELPVVLEYDLGRHARDLWVGPLVGAAMVLVIAPTASPVELQAIGGIAGLVGMLNYFIRPLYLYLYGVIRGVVSESRDSSA